MTFESKGTAIYQLGPDSLHSMRFFSAQRSATSQGAIMPKTPAHNGKARVTIPTDTDPCRIHCSSDTKLMFGSLKFFQRRYTPKTLYLMVLHGSESQQGAGNGDRGPSIYTPLAVVDPSRQPALQSYVLESYSHRLCLCVCCSCCPASLGSMYVSLLCAYPITQGV
jgi:hypothetical protein